MHTYQPTSNICHECQTIGCRIIEKVKTRPPIVCICGSSKFKDAFLEQQKRFTLEGNIVLSLEFFGHLDKTINMAGPVKKMLDALYFRKVELADFIFVVNVGGYVGWSTQNEINWANVLGKPVYYLEPVP